MPKITVTTKTSEQIAADFEAVFANIKPLPPKRPLTQKDRLEPYRKAIMKQRRRGLEWTQIAEGMLLPRINEKVSAQLLKMVFEPGKPAAGAGQKPQPKRLVLDPVTGQPIPSPAPAPTTAAPAAAPVAPMTPKEHAAWDETLQQLIPTIVNGPLNRHDAHTYTDRVVERMNPADAARFHAIVESELDAMTNTTCTQYRITPDAFAKWHRRWVRS